MFTFCSCFYTRPVNLVLMCLTHISEATNTFVYQGLTVLTKALQCKCQDRVLEQNFKLIAPKYVSKYCSVMVSCCALCLEDPWFEFQLRSSAVLTELYLGFPRTQ